MKEVATIGREEQKKRKKDSHLDAVATRRTAQSLNEDSRRHCERSPEHNKGGRRRAAPSSSCAQKQKQTAAENL